MKMGCFLFSAVFWGVIVVLVGLSIILHAFGIKIPLVKILFGLLFIYIGMSILIGGFGCSQKCKSFMSDLKVGPEAAKEGEYSVVFGRGDIDLTGLNLTESAKKIEVNTVFGESMIRIDPAKPMKINIDAVFAGARTPDNNVISFGKYTYLTEPAKKQDKVQEISVKVVFGGVQVVEKGK